MLRELRIENFALIDQLEITLEPGFIAFTGETGAGKSIIIDALNAALGERVSADTIREGAENARVEGVFDLSDSPDLPALREAGLETEDGTLVLSRTIAPGRSYYRLNGQATSLALLRSAGDRLADIHGQHEHQTLIHEESHLRFLDTYGSARHLELVEEYHAAYGELAETRRARERIAMDERTRAQRLDLLRFQVQEIDEAGLSPDEDGELAAERERLMHVEKLRSGVAEAYAALEGGTEEGSGSLQALQGASQTLAELAEIDAALAPSAEGLRGATYDLEEASRALRNYLDNLEADPARIEQVEARLNLIAGLKRKYGDSARSILDYRDEAAVEIDHLEGAEQSAEELEQRIRQLAGQAGALAQDLSAARRKLAERLAGHVEKELRPLGMDKAHFEVEIEADADEDGLPDAQGRRWAADATGVDRVRFMLSANLGEPLRPLSNVASGGELSRLMLVFKSICSRGAEIPTIVFDEVDANIGGRTAHAVAEKLVAVSKYAQVLCVTHLAQIARLADRQISVEKVEREGRTIITARQLTDAERIDELTRMLGDTEAPRTAREHAQEMLKEAAAERERIRASA